MSFKLESGPLPSDATYQQKRQALLDLLRQQENIIKNVEMFDLLEHIDTTTATLCGLVATELNIEDFEFECPETKQNDTTNKINMLRERMLGLQKDLELIEDVQRRQEKARVEAQSPRPAEVSNQTEMEDEDGANADVDFFDIADNLNIEKYTCTLNDDAISALKDAVIDRLLSIPDIDIEKHKNENPAIQLFLRLIANHALNRENPMAIIYNKTTDLGNYSSKTTITPKNNGYLISFYEDSRSDKANSVLGLEIKDNKIKFYRAVNQENCPIQELNRNEIDNIAHLFTSLVKNFKNHNPKLLQSWLATHGVHSNLLSSFEKMIKVLTRNGTQLDGFTDCWEKNLVENYTRSENTYFRAWKIALSANPSEPDAELMKLQKDFQIGMRSDLPSNSDTNLNINIINFEKNSLIGNKKEQKRIGIKLISWDGYYGLEHRIVSLYYDGQPILPDTLLSVRHKSEITALLERLTQFHAKLANKS